MEFGLICTTGGYANSQTSRLADDAANSSSAVVSVDIEDNEKLAIHTFCSFALCM